MLLFCLREKFLPNLHLHDGPAQWRHGAHDVQGIALKCDITAVSLPPIEIGHLFIVVHLMV